MNMNLFNHNNNSADNYDIVQLNSCGCWIVRLAKPALKTIHLRWIITSKSIVQTGHRQRWQMSSERFCANSVQEFCEFQRHRWLLRLRLWSHSSVSWFSLLHSIGEALALCQCQCQSWIYIAQNHEASLWCLRRMSGPRYRRSGVALTADYGNLQTSSLRFGDKPTVSSDYDTWWWEKYHPFMQYAFLYFLSFVFRLRNIFFLWNIFFYLLALFYLFFVLYI